MNDNVYASYIVVEGNTVSDLSEKVNEYILNDGYICIGGVSVVATYDIPFYGDNTVLPSFKTTFIQAMIRKTLED